MDILEYLPDNYRGSPETVEFEAALNKQAEILSQSRVELMEQLNIDTATWSLPIWEIIYGVPYIATKTQQERRDRVKAKMRGRYTATADTIINTAKAYTSETVQLIQHYAEYYFTLVFGGSAVQVEDLREVIEEIKPAHLACVIQLLIQSRATVYAASVPEAGTLATVHAYRPEAIQTRTNYCGATVTVGYQDTVIRHMEA